MKFFQLTWFHFNRIYKSLGLVAMTFIMPLFLISGLIFIQSSDSNAGMGEEVVVLNYSSFVNQNIYPKLSEKLQDSFTDDAADVFERLDQGKIAMVYEIPEKFLEAGARIQTHSLNGENNDIFFEAEFMKVLSEELTDQAFVEAGISFEETQVAQASVKRSYTPIDTRLAVIIFMIVFFMCYSSSIIGGDLNKLRSDGVLTRSIVTNARSWQILGSVLGAYTLYNFISSLLVVLLVCLIFGITIMQLPLVVGAILAFCIFNVGFSMVLFRVFKNEQIILILGMVLSIVFAFMGMGILEATAFSFVQYLSPFYWLFKALDTGIILPNIPIIALYGLVLFTAGSFKVERLVRR